MLILLCLVSILCMALLGWLRGAVTLGVGLLSLLLAGLLSIPLGGLGNPIARALSCPELLLPAFAPLIAGLIFFIILVGVLNHLVKKKRGDSPRPEWDRPVGAMLGGVWGLLFPLLCFTGLNSIARADRAMREGEVISQLRSEARIKIEREVTEEMGPDSGFYAQEELEKRMTLAVENRMKTFAVKPEQVREKIEPGPLDGFLEELETFPMESLVESFSAIDAKSEELLRDLSIVVGDPILFDRFQRNPDIAKLKEDSTLQALGRDEEVAAAIRERRFRDLLDHPKVVEAAGNEKLRQKLKNVDIDSILKKTIR